MSTMVKLEAKKTKGRRKVEIKKIENKNSRQVTFSKRRSGLFKKASEFSILTGSQMAVFALSSTNKVYTFGHPNPDVVVDRYLAGKGFFPVIQAPDGKGFLPVIQAPERQVLELDFSRHNDEYMEVCKQIAAEKKRKEETERDKKLRGDSANSESAGVLWWTKDVNSMSLQELGNFMTSLQKLKNNMEVRAEEKAMMVNYYMNQAETETKYYHAYGHFYF